MHNLPFKIMNVWEEYTNVQPYKHEVAVYINVSFRMLDLRGPKL